MAVTGRGDWSMELTAGIFDLHVSFQQAAEIEWLRVDIPSTEAVKRVGPRRVPRVAVRA